MRDKARAFIPADDVVQFRLLEPAIKSSHLTLMIGEFTRRAEMRYALAALIALPLTMGAVIASEAERAKFQPLATPDQIKDQTAAKKKLNIAPADVATVDRNRDGKVSFAELKLQDILSDF